MNIINRKILNEWLEERREYVSEMSLGLPGEYNILEEKETIQIIKLFKDLYYKDRSKLKDFFKEKIILKDKSIVYLHVYIFDMYMFFINDINNDLMGFIRRHKHTTLPDTLRNKYGIPIIISGLFIFPKYKNKGLMKKVFQILLDSNIKIITDGVDYENARRLLLSLNGIENYRIDIIEIDGPDAGNIVINDIKLKDIYDNRLWNCDNEQIVKLYKLSNMIIKDKLLKYISTRAIIYKR